MPDKRLDVAEIASRRIELFIDREPERRARRHEIRRADQIRTARTGGRFELVIDFLQGDFLGTFVSIGGVLDASLRGTYRLQYSQAPQ
jgi:hypothetical protein